MAAFYSYFSHKIFMGFFFSLLILITNILLQSKSITAYHESSHKFMQNHSEQNDEVANI